MGSILLVQVDPITSGVVRDGFRAVPEMALVDLPDPDLALQRIEREGDEVDALVLGGRIDEPIRIAQRAHRAHRDVAIHILGTPDRFTHLARAIQFAPFLSENVRCWSVDDPVGLADALRADVGRARRRRAHRVTVNRLNERLATASPLQAQATHFLDRILEYAPIGVLVVDRHGQILDGNRQASRMLGVGTQVPSGQRLTDFFPGAQHDLLRRSFDHSAGQTVRDAATVFTRVDSDGTERVIEVMAAPITGRAGEPGMLMLLLDVTARVQAERRRNEVERRLVFLADASQLLASSLDYDVTLRRVARLAVPFLADWCVVYLKDDGGQITRVALESADRSAEEVARTIRDGTSINPDAREGVPEVIRSGTPLLYPEASTSLLVADVHEPEALRSIIEPLGIRSWMCVPLSSRDQVFGAISFISTAPGRQYDDDDLRVADDLAHRAALAIENARLFQAAQQAMTDARAHAERLEALASASRAFAETSLELQPLFNTIVERVVELMGGLCIIRVLSTDRSVLEPAAVAHMNPEAADLMRQLIRGTTQRPTEGLLGQVIQSGAPLLIPMMTPTQVLTAVKPEFRPYVERFGIHSALIVPLVSRGKILGSLGVFRDEPGAPLTLDDQAFLQDLGGRAALAIENARLYLEVRDALRAREAFVSIAAHELRTPLTTVKAFGQMLAREVHRSETNFERVTRLTDNLQGQIDRLAELVDDLLDASRLQQDRLEFRRERVDLVALVQSVLERFEHDPLRTSGHSLTLDAPASVEGEWDPGRLDQVITNLVSNALKYSPQGGEVRVSIGQRDDRVELVVSDQGIGIPHEEQAELFQPFARGSAGMHGIPGTGLGLYVTAQIVERHGGSIRAESQPGEGSRFIVTLPLEATVAR